MDDRLAAEIEAKHQELFGATRPYQPQRFGAKPEWIRFEAEPRRQRSASGTAALSITMRRQGTVGLNAAAYRALGSPRIVVLEYDPKNGYAGVRPAPPDAPEIQRRKVNRGRGPNEGGEIWWPAYFERNGIPTEHSLRRPAWIDHDDDGIVLMCNMWHPGEIVDILDTHRTRAKRGDATNGDRSVLSAYARGS